MTIARQSLDYADGLDATRNYIKNGGAEDPASTLFGKWTAYADAAGTRPVDGTGGSPTVTMTRTVATTMSRNAYWLFTKDAANRQGQGVSYDFSIDKTDQAKVMQIEFESQVISGTFAAGSTSADSDLIAYIYDVTNASLIEPSSFKILSNSTTLSWRFVGNFQTSPNSTSYRLILHAASTSASAYTVGFDGFQVKRAKYVYGTPISDWTSYTPTGSWVTATTYAGKWRRVGDTAEYQIQVNTSGLPTNTQLSVQLAHTMDTAKMLQASSVYVLNGRGGVFDSSAGTIFDLAPVTNGGTTVTFRVWNASNTFSQHQDVNQTTPMTWASGDTLAIGFSVPVTGWSSSVQMSDTVSAQDIIFRAGRSASQTGINTNATSVKLTFNSTSSDTTGSFDTTNSRFVAPVSGWYVFAYTISLNGTNILGSNAQYTADFYKNGSAFAVSNVVSVATAGTYIRFSSTSSPVYLRASEYVELYIYGSGNNSVNTYSTDQNSTWFSGHRIASPSPIAATDTVSCTYTKSSTQAITASTYTALAVQTIEHDTHAAFNTSGYYTIPVAGIYKFTIFGINTTGTTTAGTIIFAGVNKTNASAMAYRLSNAVVSTANTQEGLAGSINLRCSAGEAVYFVIYSASNSTTLENTGGVSVERIG